MAMNETDATIREARQRLSLRRRDLTDELKRIDQAIAALDAVLAPVMPRTTTRVVSTKRGFVKHAALEVLREHAGPMHADEIVRALHERGVGLSARDPKATVVTAMLRMEREGSVQALGGNRYQVVATGEAKLPMIFSGQLSPFSDESDESDEGDGSDVRHNSDESDDSVKQRDDLDVLVVGSAAVDLESR